MLKLIKKILFLNLLTISWPCFGATLPIPNNLVSYQSNLGKSLLTRSINQEYLQLNAQFLTQKTQAYCGVASISMILNALNITGPDDPVYLPFHPITQENFFIPAVTHIITAEQVSHHGMTLEQAALIATQFQVRAKAVHSDTLTSDKMRSLLQTALRRGHQYAIVNFYRPAIKEQGAGHFSPIAAYDISSDRFLILDVARYKYPPVWVKTTDLWNAINTIDSTSQKYRGILLIQRQ